jgi:hypothetical protein
MIFYLNYQVFRFSLKVSTNISTNRHFFRNQDLLEPPWTLIFGTTLMAADRL